MCQPETSESSSDWNSDELRALFYCINFRGAHEGSLDYIASHMESRSKEEIKAKIEEIRSLVRKRDEKNMSKKTRYWIENDVQPSTSSEVKTWLDAVNRIQSSGRKIEDCTVEALLGYFWDENTYHSPVETKTVLLCTDSNFAPSRGRKDEVNFSKFYKFLHSVINNSKTKPDLRTLDAAILLNIYQDIQEEVDDPKFDDRRKILAGIFRTIQDGDLTDFDFRCGKNHDDTVSVQLNPLNLREEILNVGNKSATNSEETEESVNVDKPEERATEEEINIDDKNN